MRKERNNQSDDNHGNKTPSHGTTVKSSKNHSEDPKRGYEKKPKRKVFEYH